jgi:hypothetical protein
LLLPRKYWQKWRCQNVGGGGCTQANGALKTDVISKNFENLIVVAFKFWLNNLNFFA